MVLYRMNNHPAKATAFKTVNIGVSRDGERERCMGGIVVSLQPKCQGRSSMRDETTYDQVRTHVPVPPVAYMYTYYVQITTCSYSSLHVLLLHVWRAPL